MIDAAKARPNSSKLVLLSMGLPYSADTATPFVSIDPAVAEQIYRVKAFHQQLSSKSKPDPHTIAAGPQVYTTHNTARKEDENENIQEGSLPKSLERSKKNSLRRIKNSTDVLRQRSTRAQLGAEPYHQMSNSKEGCHFTVGNVGTGGKLYLRYVTRKNAHIVTFIDFPNTGRQRTNHNNDYLLRSCLPLQPLPTVCLVIRLAKATTVRL